MVDHFEPVDCSEVVVKVEENKRACRCRWSDHVHGDPSCQIKNEDCIHIANWACKYYCTFISTHDCIDQYNLSVEYFDLQIK